jgi:hypothetical protein
MLRLKLEEMTRVSEASQHPALLALLSKECPNTITVVASAHPIERYTCLMHAMNFTDSEEYAAIAERGLNVVFAGRNFAHWLIDRNLLSEISMANRNEGDLVFYFDQQGLFKHAGIVLDDERVRSKWGTGHLFEHGLFDVPESYGTRVKRFKKMPFDEAFRYFAQFAQENGTLLDELL